MYVGRSSDVCSKWRDIQNLDMAQNWHDRGATLDIPKLYDILPPGIKIHNKLNRVVYRQSTGEK